MEVSMSYRIPLSVLFVATAAACSKPVETKEDATAVSHQAASAGQTATQQALIKLSIAQPGTTVEVKGQTGTAKVSVISDVDTGGARTTTNFAVRIEFVGYSPDGDNTYDGWLDERVGVVADGSGAKVAFTLKGDLKVSGDYDSHLVLDLTMSVDAAKAQPGSSGSVEVVMKGTVKADGKTWVFDENVIRINR
jgi:hypothetical protein